MFKAELVGNPHSFAKKLLLACGTDGYAAEAFIRPQNLVCVK